jgi:ATP-dependent DNA helicase RecG
MTATPIPRTLALTIYGDLDLTLLDEMPKGRKRVITEIIEPEERGDAYEKIRKEIEAGRQAYVICPLIEEGKLESKNVKQEKERLQKEIFPKFKIEALHGKMPPKEKDLILKDFRANKIQILVSTSVIEVGIDVPNATIIVIEGAERFGLAQLHQLRGRVVRSSMQSYCFVFSNSHSQKTHDRLNALVSAKNGFELAEYDLQFRGPGELGGLKQWGVSDIGMEALKNIKMVEAARNESQKIIDSDPGLKEHPQILERIKNKNNFHLE